MLKWLAIMLIFYFLEPSSFYCSKFVIIILTNYKVL